MTNVPVALRLTMISSPSFRCWSREMCNVANDKWYHNSMSFFFF